MCIEGSLKFIFENGEEQVLERYELIEILGEERYEIVGTGVLCSINSPKFDEDTYSFVEKYKVRRILPGQESDREEKKTGGI